jgi:hypothetical protein
MGNMPKSTHRLAACALGLLLSAALRAEPAVLGLARSYLGPESTLDGIQTIHYVGTLDRVDPARPAAVEHMDLDMLFAKPMRQRLRATNGKLVLTTVLDGYDAWDWLVSKADPAHPRVKWLTANEVRQLRASTWENLYYYKAPDGGAVDDKGPATVDGVVCEEVDFSHGGTVYQRFFDRDDGRLVLTVRGADSIRESGEIRVNGVRFPKTIVTITKRPDGRELDATATFYTITLNDPVPAAEFASPSFSVPPTAPAAPK